MSVCRAALVSAAGTTGRTPALAFCAPGIEKSTAKVMAEAANISFLIRHLRSFRRNDDFFTEPHFPGDCISSAEHGQTKKKQRHYTCESYKSCINLYCLTGADLALPWSALTLVWRLSKSTFSYRALPRSGLALAMIVNPV
jgi:hypothetical protein